MRALLMRTAFLTLAASACFTLAGVVSSPPMDVNALQSRLDSDVSKILTQTRTPSASIAVVLGGRVVLVKAYGNARLAPPVEARPNLRYGIGSISKQFTAAAILLLAQDGKLSLDDRVAKFLPDLPASQEVTIRELLSHTAGYRDDLPDNFIPPWMAAPIDPIEVLKRWAERGPDFAPGTKFEYSNTDYVVAGLIVEKASGKPLEKFFAERIFGPLQMKSAATLESVAADADVTGYVRYALGPPRRAIAQPSGWLFGGGELVMTAEDLAKWDASVVNQSLLGAGSYRALEAETMLKNGFGAGYALGLRLSTIRGHRKFEHAGEIAGFYAENIQLPDDGAAVAALTNLEQPAAAREIANGIVDFILRDREDQGRAEARVRKILQQLQKGTIDRAQLTPDANAYFRPEVLADYASSLGALGEIVSISAGEPSRRAGQEFIMFTVRFKSGTVVVNTAETADGKFAQFLVEPAE